MKSKLSTAKKAKTTTFSRVFHTQKIDNFSREIKVDFLDKKNEDFEQCVSITLKLLLNLVAEESTFSQKNHEDNYHCLGLSIGCHWNNHAG